MAIIEVYHSIKVSVRDARGPGRNLTEYPDTSASSSSSSSGTLGSTQYIACRDVQAFLVHLSVSNTYDFARPRPHSLNLAVFIDSAWTGGKMCRALDVRTRPFCAHVDHRPHKHFENTLVRQPFVFSALKTVDDMDEDRLEAEGHIASTLGTIEVRVFRVKEKGKGSFRSADIGPRALELAEVSLKGRAIIHGTVFENGVNVTNEDTDDDAVMRCRQCINLDEHPMTIYHFEYRSQELLHLMWVRNKQDVAVCVEQEQEHTPLNRAHEDESGQPRSHCHSSSKRHRNTKAD